MSKIFTENIINGDIFFLLYSLLKWVFIAFKETKKGLKDKFFTAKV